MPTAKYLGLEKDDITYTKEIVDMLDHTQSTDGPFRVYLIDPDTNQICIEHINKLCAGTYNYDNHDVFDRKV